MSSDIAENACILVADDDAALRKYLGVVLRGAGYRVILAPDGKSALSAARKHEGRINLLITDVMMPRLDGFDLQEKLRLERKDLRVLIMSGQLDEEITGTEFAILRKPFLPEVFLETVRHVLLAPASRFAT